MIVVKLFAVLKDRAGTAEMMIQDRPATVGDLIGLVILRAPSLAGQLEPGRVMISVNHEFADRGAVLRDGDEVAFMPPFSGGQERFGTVRIQTGPFSVDAEIENIKRTSCSIGGIVTFLGTTRDLSRGKRVALLEFEHYPGMAEKKLAEIRERAITDHRAVDVTIVHRVGRMPVGENIVLIVAAAAHRDEAFAACRFCIDELKRITPIWKKETTPDGVVWVEEHP